MVKYLEGNTSICSGAPIFRTALFYNPYILLDLSSNQFPINPSPLIFVFISQMPVGAQDSPWAWASPCPMTELQSHPYQIPQGSWMLFRTMRVNRTVGQSSHPQPPAKPCIVRKVWRLNWFVTWEGNNGMKPAAYCSLDLYLAHRALYKNTHAFRMNSANQVKANPGWSIHKRSPFL